MFSIQVVESENTMPPIAVPTPQSLYQDFEVKCKDWSQSSWHCLSELREDREISMEMTNEIINGYESIQEVCLNIKDLEPDHLNFFPYLTSEMEKVKILWKICLLKFAFKGRSVEELEADVRKLFRYENEGERVPVQKTKNADKQVVARKIDQQEQECHVKPDEEQGNSRPEESFNEEDLGKCFPKLPSISENEIKNVNNDAEVVKMKKISTNESFSNSSFIHTSDGDDFGKVEPGGTNFPGLDKSFDNNPTKPDVDLVLVKEDPKEDSTLGMITDAEDDEEPATKKAAAAPVDVASQEREEKQEVDTDTDVDTTGLSKTMKVFNDEESHPDEDIQTKTDESFDETIQTNDEQANKLSTDDIKSDELFENDDHSKENDEVNGDKHDQVKIEELFESIAIFLFFPNYKYRKKRWPGKT